MTVYGGAARDLMRNLPAISEHFELKFLCLNLRDSQRTLIESMGIEVLCPEQQWEAEGGIWNEITWDKYNKIVSELSIGPKIN